MCLLVIWDSVSHRHQRPEGPPQLYHSILAWNLTPKCVFASDTRECHFFPVIGIKRPKFRLNCVTPFCLCMYSIIPNITRRSKTGITDVQKLTGYNGIDWLMSAACESECWLKSPYDGRQQMDSAIQGVERYLCHTHANITLWRC